MAAPTKAQADAELVDRCGGILGAAGRSVATDGTNPQTVGPLRESLLVLGYQTASFGAVTDADLAQVPTAVTAQLLDVAELRLLRNALQWYTKVDQRISLGEQKKGQLRTDLMLSIKELEARCKALYGYGLGSVVGGAVDLGFASTDPCEPEPLWPCE